MKSIENLYSVILDRKENPTEGSYTSYLFESGLDKILKKLGEECSETIIAAKNSTISSSPALDNNLSQNNTVELKEEVCDLIFHLLTLLAERNIALGEIEDILNERSNKIGNLKTKTVSNPNS